MPPTFKSNKYAVLAEMERLKALALEAIDMEYTHNANKIQTERGHVDTGASRAA